MSPLNWFRKEMPFQGLIGFGGGATGLGVAGGVSPIDASGGTTSTFSDPNGDWKAHVFTSSGTFVVNSGSGDIEYLVVAGGGGSGGGGSVVSDSTGGDGGTGYIVLRISNSYTASFSGATTSTITSISTSCPSINLFCVSVFERYSPLNPHSNSNSHL